MIPKKKVKLKNILPKVASTSLLWFLNYCKKNTRTSKDHQKMLKKLRWNRSKTLRADSWFHIQNCAKHPQRRFFLAPRLESSTPARWSGVIQLYKEMIQRIGTIYQPLEEMSIRKYTKHFGIILDFWRASILWYISRLPVMDMFPFYKSSLGWHCHRTVTNKVFNIHIMKYISFR